jgi:predicted HAD superfamily Cof-like phosphohydrolase
VSDELKALREQVTALQERCTGLVYQNRALKMALETSQKMNPENRAADVREFTVGVARGEVRAVPSQPSSDVVLACLRMLLEEVIEVFESVGLNDLGSDRNLYVDWALGRLQDAHDVMKDAEPDEIGKVDMVQWTDGHIDVQYICEGNLAKFGVQSQPLWEEVQAANMRKEGGPIVDGKLRKPEGWVGPDIEGALKRQGWSGQ